VDTLRNSIKHCDNQLKLCGYEPASSIFLLSRVGTSESARQFIANIGEDATVGDIVYTSPDDIMLKQAAFLRANNSRGYSDLVCTELKVYGGLEESC
jgi:hypothetical protein